MDLYNELQNKTKQLDISIKSLRKTGTEFAQAEYNYKIKIAEKAFEMKDSNIPITLINLTIYGIPEIARLRLDRTIKEVIYNANQESINSIKLQMRLIEGQLNREFGKGD